MPAVLVALAVATTVSQVSPSGTFSSEEAAYIREHVGVYIWPGFDLPDYDYTIAEQTDIALELGSRIVRVIYEPHRMGQADFVGLAQTPEYSRLFASFDTVILTMTRWDPNEPDGFVATEQGYESFTRYLRDAYRGSGKTFILGFWEGDNALMVGQAAIDWCAARHRGIVRGRESLDSDVRVLEMIECNHDGISPLPPQKAFTQETCMANALLPHTSADLYSFSAWEDVPPMPYRALPSSLDYLASQAPGSEAFGDRNIMLGESGVYDGFFAPRAYFEAARGVLNDARAWGAPYAVWWFLSGRDCGLVDAKWYGGRKSPLWHALWGAYHGEDDVLTIDDFDACDLGTDGELLNHLGGSYRTFSTHGEGRVRLAVATGRPSGSLHVIAPQPPAETELRGFATGLGCLDAGRYEALCIPLAEPAPEALILVSDARERRDAFPWTPRLPLARVREAGIDVSRLTSVGLELPPEASAPVEVLGIAFATEGSAFEPSPTSARSVAMTIAGAEAPVAPTEGSLVRAELRVADASAPVRNARLFCGGSELRFPYALPPGSSAWVEPGGAGGLQFAVPSRDKLLEDYASADAIIEALRWEREFRVLMLERPREDGTIAVDVASPYPVMGGRFLLQGKRGPKTSWGVRVRVGDQAYEAESIDTFGWVERERFRLPESLPPSQWFRIEAWIRIDSDEEGWVWDGSLGGLTVQLDLDCSRAPQITLSDATPGVYSDRDGAIAARLLTVEVGEGP